ncbi:hypothetical protein Taro_003271 [Colocasia esculenta]|uniref:Uncharacterized protein n=1 Tax=Colocasia esculenta TaxID=4460 RepID=A0A843TNI4_COLES|nr:hypothetical protein [Colocasia esculenta]
MGAGDAMCLPKRFSFLRGQRNIKSGDDGCERLMKDRKMHAEILMDAYWDEIIFHDIAGNFQQFYCFHVYILDVHDDFRTYEI